jgi:predicted nucleic acid-binding protein
MILVDTTVWVSHLRAGDEALARRLDVGVVLVHPFVIVELAVGNLRQREIVLDALSDLPRADTATEAEVLRFIDRHALFGRRIGYVNVHLLAAAQLTAGANSGRRTSGCTALPFNCSIRLGVYGCGSSKLNGAWITSTNRNQLGMSVQAVLTPAQPDQGCPVIHTGDARAFVYLPSLLTRF